MRFVDASVFVHAYLRPKRRPTQAELGIKESAKAIGSRVNSGEEVVTTVVHLADVANILEDHMPLQEALAVEEALLFKDSIVVVPVSREDYYAALQDARDEEVGLTDALAYASMKERGSPRYTRSTRTLTGSATSRGSADESSKSLIATVAQKEEPRGWRTNSQSPSGSRGYAYVAAAIVVAAALVSASLVVVPLETTKTSTSTATSVVTTTLPQVTSTTTSTSTTSVTTTSTTILVLTVTVTVSPPPPACGGAAPQGAPGQTPATIGTSIDGSATNSSSERKTLTAAGLVWVFYTDGCNILYQTSADGGRTWSSSPTLARAGIDRGWFFTVGQNGTTLYLVVSASDGSTGGITFRSGTMESNGAISWSGAEQDLPFGVGDATVPTVALDTSGNAWTAIETIGGLGRNIEVFRTTGGAWSQVFNVGGLADYPRPILLPLTSGKMALEIIFFFNVSGKSVIYTTANGGATWSSPVSTPQGLDNILTLSSVSVGDTVYSVTSDTSGNVDLWSYAYGGSAFAGPTTLAKCCLGYNDATISTDGASVLFVAYSNSNSVLYETSKDLGASWTSPAAITTTENGIQPGSLATSYYLTGGVVPVVWTATNGPASQLFNVRFAAVAY